MIRGLWRNFLTGLLLVFPAIITVFVLSVIFGWAYRLVINPLEKLIFPSGLTPEMTSLARGAILLGFILVVAILGFATRMLLIRRLLLLGEQLVRRVPMVGKIYWTIKEIANTFVGQRRGVFIGVVMMEWPREGMYAMGFVTSEAQPAVQEKVQERIINVFVPTTPNPTSGYLVLAPEKSLIHLDLTVEEGMRMVVSGGVTGPNGYSKNRRNPAQTSGDS